MVSLFIAALLVVLGFSTGSVWAHVTTDTPSFTEWHWRPDVVIAVTLLSTAYVAGWRRLRKRNSYRKEVATLGYRGVAFETAWRDILHQHSEAVKLLCC